MTAPFAANLESRRVDVSNPTYKNSEEDLTYPSPGCGAGPWDGLPPGHKAQQVDLELARPVLARLGLPDTREGARVPEARHSGSRQTALWSPSLPSLTLQQTNRLRVPVRRRLCGVTPGTGRNLEGGAGGCGGGDVAVQGMWLCFADCRSSHALSLLRLRCSQVALAAALRYEP